MKHPQNRALLEAFISCVVAQGRRCGREGGRGIEVDEDAAGSGSITIHFGVPCESERVPEPAPVTKPAPELKEPKIVPPVLPRIGSIVHYQWASEGEPFAAVVTGAGLTPGDMGAHLFVMEPTRTSHRMNVPYSLFPKLGCWSWPKPQPCGNQ